MTDDVIIAAARKWAQDAYDADFRNRERSIDDLETLIGRRQWDEAAKADREAEGRPCLTINGLPQFVRQACLASPASDVSL